MSKQHLSFNCSLIDYGEHRRDLALPQGVEGVLMEDDAPSAHRNAKKFTDRRAVETNPGGDIRFIRHARAARC